MHDHSGERLLSDLLADPHRFDDSGTAYALLQFYFDSRLPLETLRPLLRSDNAHVKRSAAFIVSELGSQARSLVDDVIPLLSSPDRHTRWYAMESLSVCCTGEQAKLFSLVVRMLECDDAALRSLAMRLVSNADVSQLEAALQAFQGASAAHDRAHESGLRVLVKGAQLQPPAISAMMHEANALIRRYGVIAAKRLIRQCPHLIEEARDNDDADLRKFYQDAIES